MILLTDGEDQGQRYKISEAISAAAKIQRAVYVILIATAAFYGGFGMGL